MRAPQITARVAASLRSVEVVACGCLLPGVLQVGLGGGNLLAAVLQFDPTRLTRLRSAPMLRTKPLRRTRHFTAARRERLDQRPWHPGDLKELAVPASPRFDPVATLGQLVCERGTVERSKLTAGTKQWPGGNRDYPAILTHRARDHNMTMQLRVRDSAAEMHGAAHHAPQVFQVIVDRHTASRDLGRVRLRFIEDRDAADAAVEQRNVSTGTVRLSTKEQTAVDLVARHRNPGGWNNVATVLGDLEGLDGEQIARLAARQPVAVMRRLGWLLERCTQGVDTDPLAEAARRPTAGVTLLEPSAGRTGPVDARWALIVNTEVEPDQ